VPEPEVVPVGQRRRFRAGHKLRILEEADACSEPGEIGALRRREGLYSSHVGNWRKFRARGQLDGLQPQRRSREPDAVAGLREEVGRLRCEKGHLDASLAQADAIIEVQDKVSQLPGLTPLEDGMR
jgi:transposase-like protein